VACGLWSGVEELRSCWVDHEGGISCETSLGFRSFRVDHKGGTTCDISTHVKRFDHSAVP